MLNIENIEWLVDTIRKHEEAVSMLYNAAAKFGGVDSMYNAIKRQEAESDRYCQDERNRVATIIRTNGTKIKEQRLLPFGNYGATEWYSVQDDTYQINCNADSNITLIKKSTNDVKQMTIKHLREASGMTQKAFSEYFGIPKRTIEDWEGERRKIPSYLLELMEYKLRKEGIIKAAE